MGRKCLTCLHPKRTDIELAVLDNSVSYRVIAEMYGLGWHSLQRHVQLGHISKEFREEARTERLIQREQLEEQVRDLQRLLHRFLRDADKAKDVRVVAMLAREVRPLIELLGRFGGKFPKEGSQVNVQVNVLQDPKWLSIQNTIVSALLPFPEARATVVKALADLGAQDAENA